jgi:hypothetical protein
VKKQRLHVTSLQTAHTVLGSRRWCKESLLRRCGNIRDGQIKDFQRSEDVCTGATEERRVSMVVRHSGTGLLPQVGVLVFFLTSGCVGMTAAQRDAIGQFSRGAVALGDVTATELVQMRDDEIRINVSRLTLTGLEPGLATHDELEQTFTVEAVATRVRAAHALQSYGELLLALVEDTQSADLTSAADEFVASVRGLPEVRGKIGDEQLDAIGTIVHSVGGVIVTWKKQQALVAIVPKADPAVAALCDLLAQEFDPDGNGLGTQFLLTTSLLQVRANDVFRKANTADERAASLAAYQLAKASDAKRKAVFQHVARAIGEMKHANATLTASLTDEQNVSLHDLTAFAATVQTLIDALKVLSA